MAEELMPVYEENVRGEQLFGYRTRDDLVQRVISENSDIIATLETRTDDLIDTIMIERADAENALQEVQKSLIQAQVDQVRDLESRVQATKAEILDKIADLQAKLKEDHHLPYGGDARKISIYVNEQIAELKEQWQQTLQAARDEFAAIQSGSLDDWEASLDLARLEYADTLQAKEDAFESASGFASASWDAALAAARDEFDLKISNIMNRMSAATADKKAAVQAMYDELAAKIDELYAKHDTKKALKAALDEKRAAIALRCQKAEDEINKFSLKVRSEFTGEMDKENKRFWGVSKANASQCSAAIS